MNERKSARRLLLVLAHPDDESMGAGAAIALGERPSILQVLGGAGALLGTWLAAHRPHSSSPVVARPEEAA